MYKIFIIKIEDWDFFNIWGLKLDNVNGNKVYRLMFGIFMLF